MAPNSLAIIPARAGSKGVPRKNIRLLGGYPLLAYSIVCAQLAQSVGRAIVSTDSDEIAQIALRYGAEVPFMRPAELAGDTAVDRDVIVHALNELGRQDGLEPELLVHLRPTTPLRDPRLVDQAVAALAASPKASSLRSVHPLPESPHKAFEIQDGLLVGLFPSDPRPEYYNLPRQAFPEAYQANGYVDVLRRDWVRREDTLHGPRMIAFVTPPVREVDVMDDLAYLEYQLGCQPNPIHEFLRERFPPEDMGAAE